MFVIEKPFEDLNIINDVLEVCQDIKFVSDYYRNRKTFETRYNKKKVFQKHTQSYSITYSFFFSIVTREIISR